MNGLSGEVIELNVSFVCNVSRPMANPIQKNRQVNDPLVTITVSDLDSINVSLATVRCIKSTWSGPVATLNITKPRIPTNNELAPPLVTYLWWIQELTVML